MIGQVKQVIRRKKYMLGYAIPPRINENIFFAVERCDEAV